ncbi:hypothetical protein [Streptomyces sp. NPDC048295]|uniref:hypothetical protein n=1 Tax=Streptomyces sp. NPDC048295 TaxID=3154617 RepID=UPI00341E4F9C
MSASAGAPFSEPFAAGECPVALPSVVEPMLANPTTTAPHPPRTTRPPMTDKVTISPVLDFFGGGIGAPHPGPGCGGYCPGCCCHC